MSDLQPIHCPHCGPGNSMVEAYQDDYGYWKVGCGACGSNSGTLHPNHKPDAKRLVIESWNRRPDEDSLRTALSEAEQRVKDARRVALEAAARVAKVYKGECEQTAKGLRRLKDYARSKQVDREAHASGVIESAIRALQLEERQ